MPKKTWCLVGRASFESFAQTFIRQSTRSNAEIRLEPRVYANRSLEVFSMLGIMVVVLITPLEAPERHGDPAKPHSLGQVAPDLGETWTNQLRWTEHCNAPI